MPAEKQEAVTLAPALSPDVMGIWRELTHDLCAADGDVAEIEEIAAGLQERLDDAHYSARPRLRAAALVVIDLAHQGWRLTDDYPARLTPPTHERDPAAEKARVRSQLLTERERQLREPAVQEFLRRMETRRLLRGRWVSVFDLFRDGLELAGQLRELGEGQTRALQLERLISPYVQMVDERGRCPHTGLLLRDVWRYLRHTWSTPYRSVPGRGLQLLIRDAAAPNHPVIGLAMLTSPPAQISCRDAWIGWQTDSLLAQLAARSTVAHARWLRAELDQGLGEIFTQDLLEDGLLNPEDLYTPSAGTLARLREESKQARARHARFGSGRDHKHVKEGPAWEQLARTDLFKSKRTAALADLLFARAALSLAGEGADAAWLARLLTTAEGRRAAQLLIRRAKANRMGVAVAEISVCGAVAPYNEILGGKLVSLLVASPWVQHLYAERYQDAESQIASSMAGRPVRRGAALSLLTTSSLYHVASAQYNRLSAPANLLGGREGAALRYEELGLTAGFGTSQFSTETVQALELLYCQERGGQRVNSIFGEGVNPKLRKVRDGLDLLELPSDALLRHGSPRRVYGIALVENIQESLLGIAPPIPLFPGDESTPNSVATLSGWWRRRWLDARVRREDVLTRVEGHRLTHPITHGARVRIPPMVEAPITAQLKLFAKFASSG